MTENGQEAQVKFEVRLGAKDLMDFKAYHNYHSLGGVAALLFGIIALVICEVSVNRVNISYTLMMGFFGIFFTVYTPVGMWMKARQQIKNVDAFKQPLSYTVTNEKIIVEQGEIHEELLWSDIYRIKCTGKSLILYITAVRANILPLRELGGCTEAFLKIAGEQLKPFQLKLNAAKAIEKSRR